MVELRWAETAVRDLDQICIYMAEDSGRECKAVCKKKIIDTIETIAAFPHSGRIVQK
ncbi:type II toxin-antitoxin system RelE/ParE family toxin [Anaerobacillus sp. HL2]|nr:type II toxin-antitoxin system RelE/ParE family toxin [Anaerobacillus sp. HL2]